MFLESLWSTTMRMIWLLKLRKLRGEDPRDARNEKGINRETRVSGERKGKELLEKYIWPMLVHTILGERGFWEQRNCF
jgi:hypothetical protein